MPSDIEKTGVSLLIKRDRQSLFHKEPVKVPHELRRPRFSFSIFNCQRTDGQTVKTSRRNSRPDQSASANQGNLKTKDIVASSAAALVSDRAYRPHPSHTSTLNRKKSTRSNNTLKIQTNWKRELSTGRDGRYRLGENTGFPGFLRQPERNRHPLMQSQGHQDDQSPGLQRADRWPPRLKHDAKCGCVCNRGRYCSRAAIPVRRPRQSPGQRSTNDTHCDTR